MKKNYALILFIFFVYGSSSALAQESKNNSIAKSQEPIIEGLTIYPNPTSSGKIYIATKKVLETVTTSKEVNISNLSAGVYIIKIKEGEATATRKLIVN